MKLPLGWVRYGTSWYGNEGLGVAVAYETVTTCPKVGAPRGWWCYPEEGAPYGPEPTLLRAMALAESNAKERTR